MSDLPQFVVVAKTLVQHGVALALRHVLELAGFEVSQTDVFHPFLLVCWKVRGVLVLVMMLGD
jgi:hypothetical protein